MNMKRITGILLILSAFATGFLTLSCAKNTPADNSEGLLRVRVALSGAASTKAPDNYLTLEDAEKKISDVQVVAFDTGGALLAYADLGTSTSYEQKIKAGEVTVYAVVNGPSLASVTTLKEFSAVQAKLETYNSPSSDFVQVGSNTVMVKKTSDPKEATPCPISVKRLVARVRLAQVTNNLPAAYGALSVDCVYLGNVCNLENMVGGFDASKNASYWYNPYGCSAVNGLTSYINSSNAKAGASELTYKAYSAQSISHGQTSTAVATNLYAYKNSNTAFYDRSLHTSYTLDQATTLNLVCTIKGTKYYYPVSLGTLEPNKAYTAEFIVNSIGNTGAQGDGSGDTGGSTGSGDASKGSESGGGTRKPIEFGSISVSVTVAEWDEGNVLSSEI